MQYIWVVVIEGEADNYYFSTAEKAYGYLVDRISDAALNARESHDIELCFYYEDIGKELFYEFKKDEEDFGCSYGYAFKTAID